MLSYLNRIVLLILYFLRKFPAAAVTHACVESAESADSSCFQRQCVQRIYLNKIGETMGWASLWTDPPSRRVFWLVRPHKVSNKVRMSKTFLFVDIQS